MGEHGTVDMGLVIGPDGDKPLSFDEADRLVRDAFDALAAAGGRPVSIYTYPTQAGGGFGSVPRVAAERKAGFLHRLFGHWWGYAGASYGTRCRWSGCFEPKDGEA